MNDNLAVSLSLLTAIAILVATVGGVWVWSSVLKGASGMTVEDKRDLP